jgi:hypothetical protein
MLNKISLLCILLTLIGCGKSEVDKCVESKISSRAYEMCLKFNESAKDASKSCNAENNSEGVKHIRSLREGEYREECLRAAAGK